MPVYRANYLFRAVAMPAGAHRVVFAHRARSVLEGALVSGGALLVGVLAWLVDRRVA